MEAASVLSTHWRSMRMKAVNRSSWAADSQVQRETETAVKELTSGGDVTSAIIAMEKADMTFQTMVEVRNNGVPLIEQAPKAGITQAIVLLAEALCSQDASGEADESQKTSSSRGFFGLWGGKSRVPSGK